MQGRPFVYRCLTLTLAAAGWLTGCRDEKPQVYMAPKDPPLDVSPSVVSEAAGPRAEAASAAPAGPSSPPWMVPAGWTDKPDPSGVRQASYAVSRAGRSLDIAVTAFPGGTGGELENVNRWRRELALPEIGADALNGLAQSVRIGGETGQLYEFLNPGPRTDGKTAERTYVAQLPAGDLKVYFKLRGEATLAAEEKENYLAWLASVQTGPAPTERRSSARPTAGSPGNPAPEMRGAVAPPPATDLPKWSPPAHWQAAGEKPMRLASFDVPGEGGVRGDVSISTLGGNGGGLLMNVNRWRGQVGLGQLDEAGLAKETQSLDLGADRGALVDLKGPEKRILAVVVPRSDRTWFFKLSGPDSLLTKEHDNFVQFVKSIRY